MRPAPRQRLDVQLSGQLFLHLASPTKHVTNSSALLQSRKAAQRLEMTPDCQSAPSQPVRCVLHRNGAAQSLLNSADGDVLYVTLQVPYARAKSRAAQALPILETYD